MFRKKEIKILTNADMNRPVLGGFKNRHDKTSVFDKNKMGFFRKLNKENIDTNFENSKNTGNFKQQRVTLDKKIKCHEDSIGRYLSNILLHLKNTSLKNLSLENPLTNQSEVNKRMKFILFNWLIEVHQKFKLKVRTIFLTANIFDRYLQQN